MKPVFHGRVSGRRLESLSKQLRIPGPAHWDHMGAAELTQECRQGPLKPTGAGDDVTGRAYTIAHATPSVRGGIIAAGNT